MTRKKQPTRLSDLIRAVNPKSEAVATVADHLERPHEPGADLANREYREWIARSNRLGFEIL